MDLSPAVSPSPDAGKHAIKVDASPLVPFHTVPFHNTNDMDTFLGIPSLTFICLNGAFKGRRVFNLDAPIYLGRQVEHSDGANAVNALRFPAKVVSRQHAIITYKSGQVGAPPSWFLLVILSTYPLCISGRFTYKIQNHQVAPS